MRLLDLAAEHRVHCTCFFVGWIADRHPGLVTEALRRGHEIASHGWAHRLAYQLTPREFYEDAAKAKDVLEQISGHRVLGYRSAGFSLSDRNAWVFDELLRAGYLVRRVGISRQTRSWRMAQRALLSIHGKTARRGT